MPNSQIQGIPEPGPEVIGKNQNQNLNVPVASQFIKSDSSTFPIKTEISNFSLIIAAANDQTEIVQGNTNTLNTNRRWPNSIYQQYYYQVRRFLKFQTFSDPLRIEDPIEFEAYFDSVAIALPDCQDIESHQIQILTKFERYIVPRASNVIANHINNQNTYDSHQQQQLQYDYDIQEDGSARSSASLTLGEYILPRVVYRFFRKAVTSNSWILQQLYWPIVILITFISALFTYRKNDHSLQKAYDSPGKCPTLYAASAEIYCCVAAFTLLVVWPSILVITNLSLFVRTSKFDVLLFAGLRFRILTAITTNIASCLPQGDSDGYNSNNYSDSQQDSEGSESDDRGLPVQFYIFVGCNVFIELVIITFIVSLDAIQVIARSRDWLVIAVLVWTIRLCYNYRVREDGYGEKVIQINTNSQHNQISQSANNNDNSHSVTVQSESDLTADQSQIQGHHGSESESHLNNLNITCFDFKDQYSIVTQQTTQEKFWNPDATIQFGYLSNVEARLESLACNMGCVLLFFRCFFVYTVLKRPFVFVRLETKVEFREIGSGRKMNINEKREVIREWKKVR